MKSKNITRCIRCGTCCQKGGPTLHHKDKKLLTAGHLRYQHLITIKKNALARSPIRGNLEPVKNELIKIAGKGKTWECLFYDKNKSSCLIYPHRPLECRLLKCWDTAELVSVIGKNTLKRTDIISNDDPVLKLIKTHEKECDIKKTDNLISKLSKAKDKTKILEKLTEFVRKDLEIRQNTISKFNLSLETELFYFGRPLFKHLNVHGIAVHEKNGEIHLSI